MPFRPRPRRLAMPGVRVQFRHTVADLVDLSRTGAALRFVGFRLGRIRVGL